MGFPPYGRPGTQRADPQQGYCCNAASTGAGIMGSGAEIDFLKALALVLGTILMLHMLSGGNNAD